ncbi:hypothetical protein BM524_06870 [Alteromonas mediterranea]|uniref:Uncharacterized protein n=1 Tax=Alteromonas mediterranea TaxID=314275 RepID=A0AAC9NRQ3_9ALTE|nr:hypothetical protein [Alteromonas mediterranea]APD89537.1 hypothetical protein BM524_06870 [Alteromonas mediterranea]
MKWQLGHEWSRIVTTRDHSDSTHLFSKEKRKETQIMKKLLKTDYFNAVNELGILTFFEMTLEKFLGEK